MKLKVECVDVVPFIKDIYKEIKDFDADIIVNYSEHGDLEKLKNIMNRDVCFLKQEGEDLGEKMYNAISFSLKNYKRVVLIGSDIPLISKGDIEVGFKALEKKDIVIGPTYDGGYYLIGMKELNQELFDIEYSTSSVFEATVDKIKGIDKSLEIGNLQLDIDDKSDFLKLYDIVTRDRGISCDNTRILIEKIIEKCDLSEEY